MPYPAPALTGDWKAGCNLAGSAQPMLQTVTHGDLTITFTKDGPLFSTTDPFLHRQLVSAAEMVGDRATRITKAT
jgi:hypothetical protein